MTPLASPAAAPVASILALVCGYERRLWNQKLLVMLQAFVDDSASDTGDERYFLACYINTAERWMEFSTAWAAALKAPPSIDYCHMVEAQNLRGQFKGWEPEARNRKIVSLSEVIRQHSPWSAEASLSRRDCKKIMVPAAPYGLSQPFFLCFHLIIDAVARFHRREGIRIPVDFVFDEQGGMGAGAVLFYEMIKEEHPDLKDLLGSTPVFRDDKAILPLQAADMLAWHLRREAQFPGRSRELPALKNLRAGGKHVIRKFRKRDLKAMALGMRKVPGVSNVQTKAAWQSVKRNLSGRGDN